MTIPPFHPLLAVALGLAIAEVGILATSVYLHRGLAHRGISFNAAVSVALRTFLWLATGMKAREWVAVHRKHHAATDTPDDPHSPAVLGFWRVQLGNAALYRRVARDGETVKKYARDLAPDRLDGVLFDHAFLGLGIGVVFLCLVLGWPTGLLTAAVHAYAYLALSGAVNAVGHTVGTRPNDNSATNGRLLALLTSGEGMHNNHHDAPTSARFARHWYDPDAGWYATQALAAAHLAEVRHKEPKVRVTSAS